jgi:hypothetical protein
MRGGVAENDKSREQSACQSITLVSTARQYFANSWIVAETRPYHNNPGWLPDYLRSLLSG